MLYRTRAGGQNLGCVAESSVAEQGGLTSRLAALKQGARNLAEPGIRGTHLLCGVKESGGPLHKAVVPDLDHNAAGAHQEAAHLLSEGGGSREQQGGVRTAGDVEDKGALGGCEISATPNAERSAAQQCANHSNTSPLPPPLGQAPQESKELLRTRLAPCMPTITSASCAAASVASSEPRVTREQLAASGWADAGWADAVWADRGPCGTNRQVLQASTSSSMLSSWRLAPARW